MTHAQRTFGHRPEFKDIASSSTEFVRASLDIDQQTLLQRSRRVNKIAQTAARICGETLQLEGSYDEQKIVWLTHRYIETLLARPLEEIGPENVRDAVGTDITLDTMRTASAGMSSEGFDRAAYEYRKYSMHYQMTSEGLVFTDPDSLLQDQRYKGKGCPFANGARTPFHDKVFLSVADTYIVAHERGMPKNWLEQVQRSLRLQ